MYCYLWHTMQTFGVAMKLFSGACTFYYGCKPMRRGVYCCSPAHSTARRGTSSQRSKSCGPARLRRVRGRGRLDLDLVVADQGSLKDACCPFEAWLFPPK